MRTLSVVHTEASRGLGGQEKRILLEAVSLLEEGHRVLVVGQPDGLLREEAQACIVPFEPIRMRTSWDPVALSHFSSLFRKVRPDIVHTHSSKDSWLAGLAARALRVPVVRTRHVSIPVSPHGLNWAYRLPKRVMTTAELIRQMLVDAKACDPARVCVMPTGVDFDRFHEGVERGRLRAELGLGPEVPLVGIIAQLRKSKGHEEFLAAARMLRDEGSAARFLVVGDGQWRRIYEEEADRLELRDGTVTFLGYRTDVPEIMADLDLLVIASTRTEGIPQVALQGMAMGLPVVGTNIGGIPEVLFPSGAGVIVPPKDALALAGGMRSLLAEPGRRARMGEAGRAFVRERYSLQRMIRDTVNLYEEVLAGCGH